MQRSKVWLLSALFLLAATPAWAVARHERIQVKGINKSGQAGFQLKLTLHPEGYTEVRVGLGRMKAPAGATSDDKRKLAAGEKSGYLRAQLGRMTLQSYQPHEASFDVIYGKGNSLQPGDRVDVVSAFTNNHSYYHVYGMHDGPVNQGDTSSVIKLPAGASPPSARRTTATTRPAAARRPAARRR
jgi:hypothetical protein